MKSAIWRQTIYSGEVFKAPRNVTFGNQTAGDFNSQNRVSVWFNSEEPHHCSYIVVMTGDEIPERGELVATVVMSNGYHVVHLIRLSDDSK